MTGAEAAEAGLHTLAVGTAALRRLLDRRGSDGFLVPADPALIRLALDAVRADVQRVEAMLEALADPTDRERPRIAAMMETLTSLRGAVEGLERIVCGAAG